MPVGVGHHGSPEGQGALASPPERCSAVGLVRGIVAGAKASAQTGTLRMLGKLNAFDSIAGFTRVCASERPGTRSEATRGAGALQRRKRARQLWRPET